MPSACTVVELGSDGGSGQRASSIHFGGHANDHSQEQIQWLCPKSQILMAERLTFRNHYFSKLRLP